MLGLKERRKEGRGEEEKGQDPRWEARKPG